MLDWYDPETKWLTVPTDKRGRQHVFTGRGIQVCLTLKAHLALPLWQTTGMVASPLVFQG